MKKTDIKVGKFYVAEISGNLTIVKITAVCVTGGWWAIIIIKTDSQVILDSVDRFQREATSTEVKSKEVGTRLIKFEIPDGPRVKGFDEIIKKLMAGATLPKPLPEATAAILDRIAKGEPDIQVGPTLPPDVWAEQDFRVDRAVRLHLAKIITDLTKDKSVPDLRFVTGLPLSRCEEILEVRDKLLDFLK